MVLRGGGSCWCRRGCSSGRISGCGRSVASALIVHEDDYQEHNYNGDYDADDRISVHCNSFGADPAYSHLAAHSVQYRSL